MEAKALLIHPPHQGVCGRHGTEEQRVTSGGLAESPAGTGVNKPISGSEMARDALSIDGQLRSTGSAGNCATEKSATAMGRGRQLTKVVGRRKEPR
jgi:hypothetical protein